MPWAASVDTRDFVTAGEGADVSAEFQTAATACGTGTLYLGPRAHRLSSAVSIPSGTKLTADPNGYLLPASGVAVTVGGVIDPSVRTKLFDGAAGGTVSFTLERWFRPEWFGIVGDGETDDTTAWRFMAASIPDYSTVVADAAMTSIITGMVERFGRRGIKFRSNLTPQPEGQGFTVLWRGPGYIVGEDLSATSGSAVVTTTTGQFTAAMVGQRLVHVFQTGVGSARINSRIASYQSSTQVTLEDTVDSDLTNAHYTVGGIMFADISCDHCTIEGFAIRMCSQVSTRQGFGGYISSGSTTLTEAGNGIFDQVVGRKIRVVGAGPSGTDLITTIASASSATVCTLADAAGTSIASSTLTDYIVGEDANTLPALYGIMSDLTGRTGPSGASTGTNNYYNRNLVHSKANAPWFAISLSTTAESNQEYHEVMRNTLFGGDAQYGSLGDTSISATSTTLTSASPSFTSSHVGYRVRIPGAGAAGVTLDTKIVGFTDASTVTLKDAASTSVSHIKMILGENRSTLIDIGSSFNIKKISIRNNLFSNALYGIRCANGSFDPQSNSYTSCEANWRIDGTSEQIIGIGENTEHSLRMLDNNGGTLPVTLKGCRFDTQDTYPGAGYFRMGSSASYTAVENSIIGEIPSGSQCYETHGGNWWALKNNNYGGSGGAASQTMAAIFGSLSSLWDNSALVIADGEQGISDSPGPSRFVLSGSGANGAHSIEVRANGNQANVLTAKFQQTGDSYAVSVVKGQVEIQTGNLIAAGEYAAVEGSLNQSQNGAVPMSCFLATLPGAGGMAGNSSNPVHGLHVKTPDCFNQDTVYGVRIEALNTGSSGVTNGVGIKQEGTSDKNWLYGRTFQAAPASAPTDGNLAAAQITFYLDESGNNLKIRVRYSDGTTLKTGTVALV